MINVLPHSPGHLNTWSPDSETKYCLGRLRRNGLAGGNTSLGADFENLKYPSFLVCFSCFVLAVEGVSPQLLILPHCWPQLPRLPLPSWTPIPLDP